MTRTRETKTPKRAAIAAGISLAAAFAVYSFGPEEDPVPTKPETAVTPEENKTAQGSELVQTAPIIKPGTAATNEPDSYLMDFNRLCGISDPDEFGKQTEALDLSDRDTLLSLYYTCKYNDRTDDFVMRKIFFAAIKNGNDEIFNDMLRTQNLSSNTIWDGSVTAAGMGKTDMMLRQLEYLKGAEALALLYAVNDSLSNAVNSRQLNTVEALLLRDEHLITYDSRYVAMAASQDNRDMLALMFQYGVSKHTAFATALENNNPDLADWVIGQGYGTERGLKNHIGLLPVLERASKDPAAAVTYLLQRQPSIGQPYKAYALKLAVDKGFLNSAKTLRQNGASFGRVDVDNLRKRTPEMDAFLRNNGIDPPPVEDYSKETGKPESPWKP